MPMLRGIQAAGADGIRWQARGWTQKRKRRKDRDGLYLDLIGLD
jgi:hypothetical protein